MSGIWVGIKTKKVGNIVGKIDGTLKEAFD
jgi:hypothetical protein